MSNQINEDPRKCCDEPAPSEASDCCVEDREPKVAGQDGCGCDSQFKDPKSSTNTCC